MNQHAGLGLTLPGFLILWPDLTPVKITPLHYRKLSSWKYPMPTLHHMLLKRQTKAYYEIIMRIVGLKGALLAYWFTVSSFCFAAQSELVHVHAIAVGDNLFNANEAFVQWWAFQYYMADINLPQSTTIRLIIVVGSSEISTITHHLVLLLPWDLGHNSSPAGVGHLAASNFSLHLSLLPWNLGHITIARVLSCPCPTDGNEFMHIPELQQLANVLFGTEKMVLSIWLPECPMNFCGRGLHHLEQMSGMWV